MPLSSNIDYVGGQVVPNLVEVGIGTNGQVSFYSSSRTDLVVDVEGYASPTPAAGPGSGLYNPLPAPVRICDTRAGNPSMLDSAPVNQCNGTNNTGTTLGSGGTRNVQVTGIGAIPAGAIGAVLNVTVANPVAPGYLTVYPQGGTAPTASNLNYGAGQVTANRVIVPLSPGGGIAVYSPTRADVIVDVSGYYSAQGISATGSQFNAEADPVRICDTRTIVAHNQCSGRTIAAGQTLTVPVIGLAASGVPGRRHRSGGQPHRDHPDAADLPDRVCRATPSRCHLRPQSGGSTSRGQLGGRHLESQRNHLHLQRGRQH